MSSQVILTAAADPATTLRTTEFEDDCELSKSALDSHPYRLEEVSKVPLYRQRSGG